MKGKTVNDFVKWALIAVAAYLGFRWLAGGVNASANVQAQTRPMGWGSNMVYAPGSAWQNAYGYSPYSMPQAYAFGGNVPIYANYNPDDNGFTFKYGL
jgi:hypothetical protein